MSTRSATVLVLVVAVAAFAGWRVLLPGADDASQSVQQDVSALLDTTTRAALVGAEATLAVHRSATGSYAGAQLTPPVALVRADAGAYCIELGQGTAVEHVDGPGGSPQPGRC